MSYVTIVISLVTCLALYLFFIIMETREEVYNTPGTILTSPIRIGEYSVSVFELVDLVVNVFHLQSHANLEVEPNASNLRYLINVKKDNKPGFDLDAGIDKYITKV